MNFAQRLARLLQHRLYRQDFVGFSLGPRLRICTTGAWTFRQLAKSCRRLRPPATSPLPQHVPRPSVGVPTPLSRAMRSRAALRHQGHALEADGLVLLDAEVLERGLVARWSRRATAENRPLVLRHLQQEPPTLAGGVGSSCGALWSTRKTKTPTGLLSPRRGLPLISSVTLRPTPLTTHV